MKADNKNKGKKVCRLLQDYETERPARLIIEDIMSATDISGEQEGGGAGCCRRKEA